MAESSKFVVSVHFHAEGTRDEIVKFAGLIGETTKENMQAYDSLYRDLHGEDKFGDDFRLIGASVAKMVEIA